MNPPEQPRRVGQVGSSNPSSRTALTLDDIRAHVRSLHELQGWHERSAQTRMLYLISELGELARALIISSEEHSDVGPTEITAISEEMSDIIWNVCAMSDALEIDLNEAVVMKLDSMMARDWSKKSVNGL